MVDGDPQAEPGTFAGANEPITLSDPDGAITRVAPWSTWTREQVRAPGGEPSLVTHLQDGQLWFAAGRTRSPWRHEIRIGTTSVTTPQGRFHASAADGGGATVACLAGRTRVLVKGGEPIVLRENQTAAISSDGTTVVVTKEDPVQEADLTREPGSVPAPAKVEPGGDTADDGSDLTGKSARPETVDDSLLPVPAPRRSVAFVSAARVAALVAVLAVAAASIAVLFRDRGSDASAGRDTPATTVGTGGGETSLTVSSTDVPIATSTTDVRVTTTETRPTTSTTVRSTTIVPPEVVAPPVTVAAVRSSPDARAIGRLTSCRRSEGGVVAVVDVLHTNGGPGRFRVVIGLVDGSGPSVASAQGETGLLAGGDSATVTVEVPAHGDISGSCRIEEVTVF